MQKIVDDYGMVLVLIALCVLFSVLTLAPQIPSQNTSVRQLVDLVRDECQTSDMVVVVGAAKRPTGTIAQEVGKELQQAGYRNVEVVVGVPRDLLQALDRISSAGGRVAAIATCGEVVKWPQLERVPEILPASEDFKLLTTTDRLWPGFLTRSNLLAIVDRIVVIAVIAIGMTMVIITGGIDLSVGSLIAFSAVIATVLMKQMGGLTASAWVVALGYVAGILACGLVGAVGGAIVARFKVAPFITTLSVMMMARGLAFKITGGFSIYQVPAALPWLGQGRSVGIPHTAVLLVVLYATAHIFMSHTRVGRYIYAVGGNEEAARLSGVPVTSVIVFVYMISASAAGLGGCIQASQLNAGAPNLGVMDELYVIAAVVVGGTSLSGGTGRILGTLIGAFIIAVIQNGMNLLGMDSYSQQVVLGAVILAAVLLDKIRSGKGLSRLLKLRPWLKSPDFRRDR